MLDYKELCDMVNNNHNEQKRKVGIHRVLIKSYATYVFSITGCVLLFVLAIVLLIACAG